MILGRGVAQTEAAIVAEYHCFLDATNALQNDEVRRYVRAAPDTILRRVGKPIEHWTDEDVVALFALQPARRRYVTGCFIAFLLFRGYLRLSIGVLNSLPVQISRMHQPALQPLRDRLVQTARALGYRLQHPHLGIEFNLLILLLVFAHKPLAEVTRSDFDAFCEAYLAWYRSTERQTHKGRNPRLGRLEHFLVHWGLLTPAQPILRHEQRFAKLRHEPIRAAILAFMRWCDAKYRPPTIRSYWAAIERFFLWLQDHYPDHHQLDMVDRSIALAYATELTRRVTMEQYTQGYRTDLYRGIRSFFDFAVAERLDTAPARNPFQTKDVPRDPAPLPRYLTDQEVQAVLAYCAQDATLLERTIIITLLHTGMRAGELAVLKASDIVQVHGRWKVHIHEGKGLKDRIIPLTEPCRAALQAWQEQGWKRTSDHLFTRYGRPWRTSTRVCDIVRALGRKLNIVGLTPHRFRHTFAVTLLNYGMRESAIQKLMGHTTLDMTLEYARILDQTVERAFDATVQRMQDGPLTWVPSFFSAEEYTLFVEGDTVSWIRLPVGYCRRNPKLHCESDVKCLLCERFVALPSDLPRLRDMQARFLQLGLSLKAEVVAAQIRRLEGAMPDIIPLEPVLR